MSTVKGYKVFNSDWTCRGFKFEVGKIFEEDVIPKCCERGFHFCRKLSDCFSYYDFDINNKVAEVEALGEVSYKNGDSKCCTNKIKIVRELTWNEVLELVNIGNNNIGYCNTGNYNIGYCNTGNYNSGYRNSGNYNSGYRNSGNYNSGNYNSGYYNSGDFNSGDYSSGVFNTKEHYIYMFDKLTDWTYVDWEDSEARTILGRIKITEWTKYYDMTEEEKEKHPSSKTTNGYLKKYDFKTACKNLWEQLNKKEKEVITQLPNFDKDKFKLITGIDIEEGK